MRFPPIFLTPCFNAGFFKKGLRTGCVLLRIVLIAQVVTLVIIKLIVSAGLIYLVNEIVIGRSKPTLGSLIASLPLVSLITFFWIYFDSKGNREEQVEALASHSTGVFWFVLPSLPMFLIFPALLRKGVSFWISLGICCVVTIALYSVMVVILKKFGITL